MRLESRIPQVFSGYALKYFAMAFMLCDHVAFLVIRRGIYAPFTSPEGTINFSSVPHYVTVATQVYTVLDILGHAAFPLFCFLLAEGFVHTHSRRRYLLTILLFAIISEPIYDLAHYGRLWDTALQNVLFTLAIGVGELWIIAQLEGKYGKRPGVFCLLTAVTIVAAGGLALLLRSEYVFLGTTVIALFYLLRKRGLWRLLGIVPLLAASPWVLLAVPLLALYSGQRGRRGSKYFFYIFYPAHFLVLMGISTWCATFLP